MQNLKMLQRSLRQRLNRGVKVIVGESYPEPALRGKEMVLASKSTVKCNGKGRCAHDACVGLAVFVTEPGKMKLGGKKGDKAENIGWRKNTTKICLTHLRTPEGEELAPEQEEQEAPQIGAPIGTNGHGQNRVAEHFEPSRPAAGQGAPLDVSWEALAQASGRGDLDAVTRIARALKSETERLRDKLVDTQDRLLSRS